MVICAGHRPNSGRRAATRSARAKSPQVGPIVVVQALSGEVDQLPASHSLQADEEGLPQQMAMLSQQHAYELESTRCETSWPGSHAR